MTLAAALPLPVVLPLGGAALSPLLAHVHRRLALVAGMAALAGSTAILALVAGRVYSGPGEVVSHYFSNQRPVHGAALGIAFSADPFGVAYALLASGLGLLLLLSALSELGDLGPRELGGLACLFQLLVAALIGVALTGDLINLFVWFQVAALASYGLTGFFLERPIALEAAFKLVVLTSIASFTVFIGSAMLYQRTGALNLGQLHDALTTAGPVTTGAGRTVLVALALLVAGFGTKAGVMPFHAWLPDAHTPVPGAVSALFSAVMVGLGVVGLARLALQVFDGGNHVLGLLTALGAVSAVAGAGLALVQPDLKRLLAWDTVSQMGILLIGFGTAVPDGVAGAVYHLVNHGLFKALLFLCAGAVVHATGQTQLADMGGLVRRRPLITVGFTLGTLAISGVPPLNGYVSLGLIHEALRQSPAVLALALLAQALTTAALGRAAWLAFYRPRGEPYEHLEPQRWGMRISLLTVAGGCIAFGVLPGRVLDRLAGPAASVLLHPDTYASGVLSGTAILPSLSVHVDYLQPSGIAFTAAEIALGVALAVLAVRRPRALAPLQWLRHLHTGSVNDYAAFSAVGIVVAAVVLLS